MQPTNPQLRAVLDVVLLMVAIGLVVWVLWRWFRRSENPRQLIIQWVLTAITTAGFVPLFRFLRTKVEQGVDVGGALFGIFGVMLFALVYTIIWRHNVASLIAKPFASLYDGGDRELDPQAYYSIAESKRKRGHYAEAIAEIRKQLKKFPNDFHGHMLLAEIQADNLNDLQGAELTINRFCRLPGLPVASVVFALNSLADWHLKYALDRDAARRELARIVEMFPDSQFALAAEQRIAHMADEGFLMAAHDRPKIKLPRGVDNVGLLASTEKLKPKFTDPAALAAEYVKRLEQHPQDVEAREQLAVVYADHFGRLDLAKEQLDQLIEHPNQPVRMVERWLNLLADLQIRHDAGYNAAWLTLGRIIEKYPGTPTADMARNRMDLLKLQMRSKEKSHTIKLGSYEQNIGLKRGLSD